MFLWLTVYMDGFTCNKTKQMLQKKKCFVVFYCSIYFIAAVCTRARNNPAIKQHLHIFTGAAIALQERAKLLQHLFYCACNYDQTTGQHTLAISTELNSELLSLAAYNFCNAQKCKIYWPTFQRPPTLARHMMWNRPVSYTHLTLPTNREV